MDPLLLDIPTEFSSERLLLRCYHPGEGAMYFQMLKRNREHLYEYMPYDLRHVQTEEDVEVVLC